MKRVSFGTPSTPGEGRGGRGVSMSTPLLEQVATMKRRYASKIKTLKQQNALLNTKLDDQDVLIKGMAASPPSAAAHPLEARKKALLEKLNSTHKGIAEKVKTKRSLQRGVHYAALRTKN